MTERHRIKLSEEIDIKMKERIKYFVKSAMLERRYFTFVDFCGEFNKYLVEKGKRTNFTDRVLSNKLTRGDIRFYEIIQILDFLNLELSFKEKSVNNNSDS